MAFGFHVKRQIFQKVSILFPLINPCIFKAVKKYYFEIIVQVRNFHLSCSVEYRKKISVPFSACVCGQSPFELTFSGCFPSSRYFACIIFQNPHQDLSLKNEKIRLGVKTFAQAQLESKFWGLMQSWVTCFPSPSPLSRSYNRDRRDGNSRKEFSTWF